jgi:hypothetical protein
LFSLKVGKLPQAHLKTLTIVLGARFGGVALVRYVLGDFENEGIACRSYPGAAVGVSLLPDVSDDAVVGESRTETIPRSTWMCSRETRQFEVVKLLLADERVDPAAQNNWAIRHASEHGYLSYSLPMNVWTLRRIWIAQFGVQAQTGT